MTEENKSRGRVKVIPKGLKPKPDGLKRLPTLAQRIAGLVANDKGQVAAPVQQPAAQKPGGLIQGLGRRSPIKRAKRAKPVLQQGPGAALTLAEQYLNRINTPLRAQSGLPTLAERIRAEGVAAQRSRKKRPAAKGKPITEVKL